MKIILLVIFLCIINLVQAQEPVSEIVRLTKVKESAEQMAKLYLNKFKRDYPKVSPTKWQYIENSLNHEPFINQVASIYRSNYTSGEIQSLLNLLQKGEHSKFYEQTKKTDAIMYEVGKSYGKSLSTYIFNQIN